MAAAWVRLCALVLIGVSSGAALAKDKTPTAIVVGGGLAGLTAAYELQSKGWQVTLLEAKSGMGGRSGLATSEWIGNAKAQPVLNQYLDRFKLETLPAPEFVRTPGYLIDGEYFSATDLATKQPATAEALKRYEKTLDDLARSIDDPLNPQATSTLFALDQINVSTWLDKLQLPATARQLVNQQIRSRYDEPSRLSLLYFAQQNRVYRGVSDRDLRAARLPGGSPVLAQAFVKQLKTIKTSSPVTAIVQDKDGVTVKVGSVGYQADYLVMAVPLRALAKIQMTPGLDNQHLAAIKGTNYGWRDQLMLKFKKPVWESRARMSGEIFSNAGLGMLWIEPALKGGANVVINLSGDNARLLQAFGDKQMVDQVLIRLHAFYPQARGSFTGYEVKRYSTDAGMGGAYLAYGPGQISKYWRLWERPVQRITFAGEHTDALYPGTLEGALRSGQRAASQAQDLLAGKSFDPAKAVPVAAAAAAGAAAAKDKGGFFSNMFGGGSGKTDKSEKAPAKAEPLKDEAKQDKPGFFSRLFGGADKPEVKAEPLAKADEVAPAPAAPTPVAPAVEAKQEAAKPAAAKPAATQVTPAKHAPAHKPAAKQAHKPVEAKKATAKSAPAKKPVADTQAKAG
ncbi:MULTISPECIES: flavin monoamine oxidase family protein [Pseudomonas]|uniref:Tryptophan 2-monooxygenase n=1 Tax=Pseudomonas capeferrum TaxID=1495066 RepID=A0ABY7R7S9_9PSED|nr:MULTISPECIES: flavin monoamine oxidase family protein [Pseudomonas]MDD2061793.1 FAD-dependent oxidoreductase [Pseudomonas sp. 25571]MUT51024.1 FAD-dependent oxidoreductase [Pseudomonas sp. TDA1]UDU80944.1 FAD-dependent oxidoreductase [Pseudomonas sp. HN2-3]UPL06408.1 Pseudooxynicotine oxidase [Pseudomonas sp. IsoF]WCH99840.1 FAD-dependent oxidoreductase [Pseudomonas capeferrum]